MNEQTGPGPIATFVDRHPEMFDGAAYSCGDAEVAELVGALGQDLPTELEELLRISDGGLLHGPHNTVHLANAEQLVEWATDGLVEELETVPFAHDDANKLLVIDPDGKWGQEGAIYRVQWGRRTVSGYPVQDVVRLADSMSDFFAHLAEGRDAW